MNARELITEARTWIGVPFRHQGRSRLGVDCAGFVEMLVRTTGHLPVGYEAPTNYARRPNGQLLEVIRRYCTEGAEAKPGTLVLIRWLKDPQPSHVALCTGSTLIHAYQRVGKVIENGYRGHWLRDTHSTWRLPGISDV